MQATWPDSFQTRGETWMLQVPLIRQQTSDQGTEGILYACGHKFYTMEPPDRNNQPNISNIPPGSYVVERRWSQKYKDHFWVTEVKGRSFILIHPGNVGGDRAKGLRTHTWGCILLGLSRGSISGQRAVLNSKTAVRRFQSLMRASGGSESFKLHIMEAEYGL